MRSRAQLESLPSSTTELSLADTLNLVVTYTPTYPDEPPEMEIEVVEGDVSAEEEESLLAGLRATAEENLGMVHCAVPLLTNKTRAADRPTNRQAMVYTLALQLKELIADMLVKRKERIAREDEERYRREEEVSFGADFTSL